MSRKYITFNYPFSNEEGGKTLLTGIRGVKCNKHKVYICGFYEPPNSNSNNEKISSFVYKGKITKYPKNKNWYIFDYPSDIGRTVTATNLYGPNNGKRKGCIQVVGNYITQENGNFAIGCLYQGPLNGSGKWTTLIPKFKDSDEVVINTIAHSTMGGLVVGNYDTQINEGKAFIYDIKRKIYHKIENKYYNILSITAYGIWHNCDGTYSICGGYFSVPGLEKAYLVDWDNDKFEFKNWRTYQYNNNKSIITHFDGITSNGRGGYNLTGDQISRDSNEQLGFFAKVKKYRCKCRCKSKYKIKKSKAKWYPISYPKQDITSGNSVYKNVVIGVYSSLNSEAVNGYYSL